MRFLEAFGPPANIIQVSKGIYAKGIHNNREHDQIVSIWNEDGFGFVRNNASNQRAAKNHLQLVRNDLAKTKNDRYKE